MNLYRMIYGAIILSVLAFSVFAQDVDETISIETNLVNLNVAIFDGEGKFVEGLKKDNFEIYDNGKRQEIGYFSTEETPVSFGIVYDMHPTTDERTKAVLESLREFTKTLRKKDNFFSIVFNKRGSLVTEFIPTAEQVNTHISGKYREPNALYDAIYLAAEKIGKKSDLKKVILVITDSADHNSEHRYDEILTKLKVLDAQVYTVLWDEAEQWAYRDITRSGERRKKITSDASGLSRAALQELAMRTGGTVQSPTVQNAAELFSIFEQISIEIHRQYSVGFYPESSDGKWHDLKVGLKNVKNSKKMSLTYRLGYQSPKKL